MFQPWKLVEKYLNLELSAGAKMRVQILERPGLWMEAAQLDNLVRDLRHVASRVLAEGDLDYGVLSGEKERLDNIVVTLIRDRESGRPVAFNALTLIPVHLRGHEEEVLHLGLVMVDPEFRSRGLSWILYGLTCILLFLRNQLRPSWISNVTQVPAVVGMVSETFVHVFPSIHKTSRRTHDHLVLAREILRDHRHVFGVGEEARFNPESFIIENAYTGGSDHLKKSFDQAAQHRNTAYNELCRRSLDYQRGDDFLQLGRVSLRVLYRYLLRSVPKRSLPAVLGSAFYALISSIVLPVVHWLSANRRMGELRPWKS